MLCWKNLITKVSGGFKGEKEDIIWMMSDLTEIQERSQLEHDEDKLIQNDIQR